MASVRIPALILGLACGWLSVPDQAAPHSGNVETLNVIVRDGRGQPVGDLTMADFQVFDQGKRRPIVFLRQENGRKPAAPLGPNQYSNRTGGSSLHATVLLFDLLNLTEAERGDALGKTIRSLQQLSSRNNVYLYFLTPQGNLNALHGLPATGENSPDAGSTWTEQIRAQFNVVLHRAGGIPTDTGRAEATYRALQTLTGQMLTIPGRKDLIWITRGVPISTSQGGLPINFLPRLRQLSASLAWSNIAINPVYAPDKGLRSTNTVEDLAELTGGKLYDIGDIPQAISDVMEIPLANYWLTYQSPDPDGKFHAVRVSATRRGERVQTISGYQAFQDLTARAQANATLLREAIASLFDGSEVGLSATVSRNGTQPPTFRINAKVDADDLLVARQGLGYRAQLDLTVVLYPAMREPDLSSNSITVSLTKKQRDQTAQNGISIGNFLISDASVRKVRIIVTDRGSGGIGSITIPIPTADPTLTQ